MNAEENDYMKTIYDGRNELGDRGLQGTYLQAKWSLASTHLYKEPTVCGNRKRGCAILC